MVILVISVRDYLGIHIVGERDTVGGLSIRIATNDLVGLVGSHLALD